MLQHGIAEPSCSMWSSPCFLVDKSDGGDCFCMDFRKVNSMTKPDLYPLPWMEDLLDLLFALTEWAKDISAFVSPNDFLQYKVMAFGMCNAPATFQHLMNVVLSGLAFCEAYLDDLVVCSESWVQRVGHLHTVFCRLEEASLKVNLSKCEFGQATMTYFGKVVGGGQVHPVGKGGKYCGFSCSTS